MGDITNSRHRRQNIAELDLALIPTDLGAVSGVVHPELQHSRQVADMLFIQPDAGGAHDAFQHQRGFADLFAVGADKALLHIGPVVQLQAPQLLRDQVFGPARWRGAMAVEVGQTRCHDSLRHRLAAVATHGLTLAVNQRGINCAGRNRQTAMKTGGFSRNRAGGHEGFSSA